MSNEHDMIQHEGETIKGAQAGQMFGLALGGAINQVAGGAQHIIETASNTVFGTAGGLGGVLIGGAIEATRAVIQPDRNKSIEELDEETDRDIARMKAKARRKRAKQALKAQAKAEAAGQRARQLQAQAKASEAAALAMIDED